MSGGPELISRYEAYLINIKRSTKNTCLSYTRDVQQFADYLDEHASVGLMEADRDAVGEYVEWMLGQNRASSSVSRSLASLKSFYNFLISEEKIKENPIQNINISKVEKKLPQVLTNAEVELLLSQPRCTDPKGYRDHAMLELLYATGLRVSELVSLDTDDVYITSGVIRCSSGGKERLIPMYPQAVRALLDYLRYGRDQMVSANSGKALFLNRSGERISRQGFWKIIKHYQETAGIEKDITPHTLRHSFAAHLLENGADIRSLQEMMGHADVSSTQVYTLVVQNHLRDVYDRSHPMA